MQRKVSTSVLLRRKKMQSSKVPLKRTLGANFIQMRKCCAFGTLDFPASQLILFKTCEAKTASSLQAK